MKTFVPRGKTILRVGLALTTIFFSISGSSQIIPELVFQNPVLQSGSAGQDGAKYLFSNAGPGIDVEIQILNRSNASVVLSSMDTSGLGLGYTNAFQPVIGIPGNAPANTTWSMKFKMIFYQAGTNTKIKVPQFYVTGLDIDGDGQSLYEWTQMDQIETIDSSVNNNLTFTQIPPYNQGWNYKVTGIIANSPGIDTSAVNVMATYKYLGKDNIFFTIGATTSASTTTAGMRLNSLWFKQFNFNITLPVKLISFTATLNNNSKVDLKWTTASEINASHFAVEKSLDGIDYTEAGLVFAYGSVNDNTNYSFADNLGNTSATVIYYRLRSVDTDGKAEYSETRMIRIGKGKENTISILAYPNPVVSELRITIPATWQNKAVTYQVYSINGQVVNSKQTGSSSQTETINVSKLAPGMYIIKASCGTETAQQKFVKQ